jgi:uncharacterized membrane protein
MTAISAKLGITNVNLNLATAIRTVIKYKSGEIKLTYEDFLMKKITEITHQKLRLYITKPSIGKDYNDMIRDLKGDMGERRTVKY